MNDHILCPHCGKQVHVSAALKHQFQEQIRQELEQKHKGEIQEIQEKARVDAEKKIRQDLDLKLKNSESELDEAKKRNKELYTQLLEMNKTLRELGDRAERQELEMQKKLIEEREKIKDEISKREEEKSNLKLLELSKQLEDTKKALTEAQRKAEQKSQQLQGEVLELDLEQQLAEEFPSDEITPVPKGIEGADVWQKVRNKFGQVAGSIVWETKRTKAWSNAWLAKLRQDTRKIGASCSILVSEALPPGVETFTLCEGVWVTCQRFAIPLACVVRIGILQVAIAKSAAAHKDEKLEELYKYLTNDSFRHRFEAQVESIIEMKQDLDGEQRSTMRLWKKREMQISRMRNNLSSMYGELQGIVGQALPTIPSLDSSQLLTSTTKSLLDD